MEKTERESLIEMLERAGISFDEDYRSVTITSQDSGESLSFRFDALDRLTRVV